MFAIEYNSNSYRGITRYQFEGALKGVANKIETHFRILNILLNRMLGVL